MGATRATKPYAILLCCYNSFDTPTHSHTHRERNHRHDLVLVYLSKPGLPQSLRVETSVQFVNIEIFPMALLFIFVVVGGATVSIVLLIVGSLECFHVLGCVRACLNSQPIHSRRRIYPIPIPTLYDRIALLEISYSHSHILRFCVALLLR